MEKGDNPLFERIYTRMAMNAWQLMMICPDQSLFVLGKRDKQGGWKDIRIDAISFETEDCLIIQEPIPLSLTFTQLQGWMRDRLRREPILTQTNEVAFP